MAIAGGTRIRGMKSAILAAALLGLAACAGIPVTVNKVAQRPPLEVPIGAQLAPIKLDRVSFKIKRGTPIGEYTNNLGLTPIYCKQVVPNVFWNQGRVRVKDLELEDIFYEALSEAAYNVTGNPTRVFSDAVPDTVRPKYLIGAQVTEIAMKLCERRQHFTDVVLNMQSGEGSIKVTWQVYSPIEEKVVAEMKSEGYGKLKQGMPAGEIALIGEAFASAAKNFAADRRFLDLVSRPEPAFTDIRAVKNVRLLIDRQKQSARPITEDIDLVRQAVVTIDTGRTLGFGSGFFISPRLILTNNHVVEGNQIVRITLVTGRRLLGEVIRRHTQRDVALVQVEEAGHRPLPIRMTPLKVTEEVFAIGTPIKRKLRGTVSRGIVSAFRSDRFGQEDIQADVDIHGGNSGGALLDGNGNVVGITVRGYSARGSDFSTGLNLFVPIYDALAKLNMAFKDEARAKR